MKHSAEYRKFTGLVDQLARRLARGNAETRSGVSKTGGRESAPSRTQTKEAKSGQAAFRFFGPLRQCLRRRPIFCPPSPSALHTSDACPTICEHKQTEAGRSRSTDFPSLRDCCIGTIAHPNIETGGRVPPQRNSLESALEQTPVIFQTIRVNPTVYVLHRVVDDLVLILIFQSPIAVATHP